MQHNAGARHYNYDDCNNNTHNMSTNNTKRIAISMLESHLLNTGLGEFENSIAQRMAQRAPMLKEKYGVTLCFIVAKRWRKGSYGDNVEYLCISRTARKLLNLLPLRWLRPVLLPNIDLLHWTNQFFKFKVRLSPLQLITVHDVNFMHNEINAMHKKKKLWVMAQRMAKATHFTFISEFTRSDFGKHFSFDKPSRVIVNGVTNLNTQPQEVYDATLKAMGVEPGYLFHISRWSRKKNVHLLVDMMRHLPGERLVIAGTASEKFGQMLRQRAIEAGHGNITFVGKVNTAQKAALLSRCKGLLFPSRSEGFGLPVVEAMCFGKPSFLTRLTSLPEVGGKEAYYFDSLDPADMATTVSEGLADFASAPEEKAARLRQRAAQFDWDKAVDEYIDFYLDILGIKH